MSAASEADAALETAVAVDTLVSQDSAVTAIDAGTACANCGSARTGNYCATCGQKALPVNPPVKYFLSEAAHELLNFDGKILRSMRLLITRPGFLTKEIFAGRRASYVSPIRLYLVFSVIAFALGAALPDGMNIQYTPAPGETASPEVQAQLERTVDAVNATLDAWVPRAMFVLVPLLAAFVMLVRQGSGLNYPQHLYFALHALAFYFFVQSLLSGFRSLGAPEGLQSAAWALVTTWFIAYFVLAFRTAYGTTIVASSWRSGIALVLYFAAVTITLLAIAVPAMFGAWGDGAP